MQHGHYKFNIYILLFSKVGPLYREKQQIPHIGNAVYRVCLAFLLETRSGQYININIVK